MFPTDFSDVATDALEIIKQLKDSGSEEVIVINVIGDKFYCLLDEHPQLDWEEMAQESIKETARKLSVIACDLQKEGFKVKIRVARGAPFSEILKAERQENVSLVVLGSHRKSKIRQLLLGSVSSAVIRKSEQPVLVVTRGSYVN